MVQLNVSSINSANIYRNQVGFRGAEEKKPEQATVTKPDKKMSNAVKYAIGATILAGTIAAGILYHKKIESNKLTKKLDKTLNDIKRRFIEGYNRFTENKVWDTSILEKQLANIEQLPKNERAAKLDDMLTILNGDRGLSVKLDSHPDISKKFVESLPADIKAVIESGDRYKASKMYIDYCDSLFHESTTRGKNLGEALENVFGKKSAVKPHNYDVSKEYSKLVTNANTSGSGYQRHVVTSKNQIADRLNYKAGKELYNEGCYSHGVMGRLPKDSTTPIVKSGVTQSGQKYVGITYGYKGADVAHGFTLYAPKGQSFTPAQKDLLSIDTSKLSKEDINILLDMPRGEENSNYDVVLSVVKHLADKFRA